VNIAPIKPRADFNIETLNEKRDFNFHSYRQQLRGVMIFTVAGQIKKKWPAMARAKNYWL
jgi:hypothetical protein